MESAGPARITVVISVNDGASEGAYGLDSEEIPILVWAGTVASVGYAKTRRL